MQHKPINLLQQLELVAPIVKHRKLLKSVRRNNWVFQLYFGPSLASLQCNVHSLEYTVSGYTDNLSEGPEPSMPEDHSGVMIKFSNKAFASWTKATKEDVIKSTNLSFNNQFSLDILGE